jgi:hypothetical protein
LRILILESISGLRHEIDPRLFPEGFGMLRTMVDEFSEAGFDVITVLNRRLKSLAGWLDAHVIFKQDGLDEVLKCRPDASLVIAPEKGRELEQITAKLRRKGVAVLGAREGAIRASADKWLTYLALKGKVPQPKTWRKPPNIGERVLIKPADGVGCEGIRLFTSSSKNEGVIFQELLEGEHASCCLLMGEGGGVALSVNKQEIITQEDGFEYLGGGVPLNHKSEKKCAEIALSAAKAINLRGYCGVDLIVGGAPHFIELNPRVTTSFIALAQVLQTNLGKLLVDVLVEGNSPPKPKLKGHSLMRIPRAKSDVKVDAKKLGKLREIPGVITPPFTSDGNLMKGSPMLLAAESGGSVKAARRKLVDTMEEALAHLGVDGSAIAWP